VDILLLESLIPEAMAWLEVRHRIAYRPELVRDERALRHSTSRVRAIVVPNQVVINQEFLDFSPDLEIVARMQIGTDNIDLESCRERGIKVLQARSANVPPRFDVGYFGQIIASDCNRVETQPKF
jgi:phosphoglycerate dehydrogenase-like enzyme